jgi:hypothetical protein
MSPLPAVRAPEGGRTSVKGRRGGPFTANRDTSLPAATEALPVFFFSFPLLYCGDFGIDLGFS